jgi:MerR family transcriptional regulator, heat shock protein HspR
MPSNEPNNIYRIGEVARKLSISVETIRVYEREGLLISEKTESGQRHYYDTDVDWLTCIRRLIKEEGLNIEGIRRILAFMPCWEWHPCSAEDKQNCPASKSTRKPCWMLKDEVAEICRNKDCRKCTVYTSAIKCENLKPRLFAGMQTLTPPTSCEV